MKENLRRKEAQTSLPSCSLKIAVIKSRSLEIFTSKHEGHGGKKRFHATKTLPTFQFLLKQYDDISPPPPPTTRDKTKCFTLYVSQTVYLNFKLSHTWKTLIINSCPWAINNYHSGYFSRYFEWFRTKYKYLTETSYPLNRISTNGKLIETNEDN